jgi:hypothetical protein
LRTIIARESGLEHPRSIVDDQYQDFLRNILQVVRIRLRICLFCHEIREDR